MTFEWWFAYLLTSLILSLSPGSGAINTMTTSINHGYRGAAASIAGLQTGLGIHIVLVGIGLGTLFSRSLGTLLGNGVPLLTALHISTQTVTNLLLRQPLETMAPKVKEGTKVADAAIGTGVFEPLAINLMRVGEETGRIGPMTLELANILNREVEVGIKRTLTLVEPVLILVLGILIASIIVSILLGILSVNDLAA